MHILRIVLKELKQQSRNWRPNAIMILFPIALTAVLGTALSGVFASRLSLSDISVSYTDDASGPMQQAFAALVGQMESMGMHVHPAQDADAGKQAVKNGSDTVFLAVSDGAITIYRTARRPVETGIVRAVLTSFLIRYDAVAAAARAGRAVHVASEQAGAYVTARSVTGSREPGAIDYYAVTMLTLIVMYGSLRGMGTIREEQVRKTGNRIMSAPVRRSTLLAGKVLGAIITVVAQMIVVFAVTKWVFGAYWGHDLATIALIVVFESIMAVSIGVTSAYVFRADGPASALLNVVIPVIVFFGGGYVPLSSLGSGVQHIAGLSPLTWVNRAMFGVIYDNDYSDVLHAVAITGAVAVAFIAVSALLSRREAR